MQEEEQRKEREEDAREHERLKAEQERLKQQFLEEKEAEKVKRATEAGVSFESWSEVVISCCGLFILFLQSRFSYLFHRIPGMA